MNSSCGMRWNQATTRGRRERSRGTLSWHTLWKSREEIVCRESRKGVARKVGFGKNRCEKGYPPSPAPSECLDWRGVCKNGLQNLERLRVRGQNLYNKGVVASFAEALSTASALTMICCLNFEVKVGCHKSGLWKKSKIHFSQRTRELGHPASNRGSKLALVQALHVGVGVDARGVGLVGFPEVGCLAQRDAVSEFAQRLGSGHAGVDDARGQRTGRLCRGDLDDIFSNILTNRWLTDFRLSGLRLTNFWLTPEDAGEIRLGKSRGGRGWLRKRFGFGGGETRRLRGERHGWRGDGAEEHWRIAGDQVLRTHGEICVLSGADSDHSN